MNPRRNESTVQTDFLSGHMLRAAFSSPFTPLVVGSISAAKRVKVRRRSCSFLSLEIRRHNNSVQEKNIQQSQVVIVFCLNIIINIK